MNARIICRGVVAEVLEVRDHAPGTHPDSPIGDRWTAREWVTANGSRWSGVAEDGQACHPPLFV